MLVGERVEFLVGKDIAGIIGLRTRENVIVKRELFLASLCSDRGESVLIGDIKHLKLALRD